MAQPTVSYNDLAKQYGLSATPESVVRLTQLVSKQDADMDESAVFARDEFSDAARR